MNKAEILEKITEVVRDQLDVDDITLAESTVSSEVDGWDSLANVRVMIAVEQAFGVRFSTAQIASVNSVGELVEIIAGRTSG